MYTCNGTKPSVLQKMFKFKMKQPLTFTQVGQIAAGSIPVDLRTEKKRYMLMYPIPVEPAAFDPATGFPYTNNGSDINPNTLTCVLPAWHCQFSGQMTFYDA